MYFVLKGGLWHTFFNTIIERGSLCRILKIKKIRAMKSSVKNRMILIAATLFIVPATFASEVAQPVPVCDTLYAKNVGVLAQNQVSFVQVRLSDVPQIVKSEVAIKYAAYRIGESYKGSDDTYKLIIENGSSKLTLIYRKTGQCVKSDCKSAWKKVMWG